MAATTKPTKKTATKKSTAVVKSGITSEDIMKSDFDMANFVPPTLVRNDAKPELDDSNSMVMFTKDDGTEVRVPNEVSFNKSLQASRILNTEGMFAAQDYAMTAVLGAEDYKYLLDFPDLTQEQWDQINGAVLRLVLGPLEESGKA